VQGARAVQRSIIQAYPDADISIVIVWIDMLENDYEATARRAAAGFAPDGRVRHFHDPRRMAGRAIAAGLGATEGQVAWDIYLFYGPDSQWTEDPPAPAHWVHQLADSTWADAGRYHTEEHLVQELNRATKEVTGQQP
jgi:hypothetical protein